MSKNQRYNASITIGSVLENSVKKNIGVLTSGLTKVGDAIKDVERRQKELTRQRNALRKQGEDVSHLDREYEKLDQTLKDLRRSQERWNRAAAASNRVGSTFRDMTSDIGRQARRLAVGAAAAGGAIFGLASSTASLGDEVAKSADKLGFGIAGFQELRYAAERSGVATSTFDSSMVAMTKRVGEAAQGFGAGKKALDKLGLSAKQMVKLSPEDQLALIAERMQRFKDPAEQAAIASGLFSRAGIGMVNMLRGGSDGLEQLREDARRTGYVLSEKAARDAEVFQDTLLDTQLAVAGLKNTIGAALMPVVTTAMKRVGDSLIGNRDAVEQWANTFADGVERALPLIGEVVTGMHEVGSVVWTVVESTAEMVGGWENFGMVIGGVLAAKTVMRVAKFGVAVVNLGRSLFALSGAAPLVAAGIRAIGAALIANPIGLAVAAIAGGAALIYKNWDKVGRWFSDMWGSVKTTFGGFGDFVGGVFTGDLNRARDGLKTGWKGLKGFYHGIWAGIGAIFKSAYENLIRPVTDRLGVTSHIESAWKATSAALSPLLGNIGQYYSGLASLVGGTFTGDMQRAADGLSQMWGATKDTLKPVLGAVGAAWGLAYRSVIKPITDKLGVTTAIENAWSGLSTAASSTMTAVGTAFDNAWQNFVRPAVNGLQATGGIGAAWQAVKDALDPLLTWIGDKFNAIMSFIEPVIAALKWTSEKGGAAVGKVAGLLGLGGNAPDIGREAKDSAAKPGKSGLSPKRQAEVRARFPSKGPAAPRAQNRALGGHFNAGWLVTGEAGPEVTFANRPGYVANNRAMRQLAEYATRIGAAVSGNAGKLGSNRTKSTPASIAARNAQGRASEVFAQVSGVESRFADLLQSLAPVSAPSQTPQAGGQIIQHITNHVHTAGASADEIIRRLDERSRQAAGTRLYDRAPELGAFGG